MSKRKLITITIIISLLSFVFTSFLFAETIEQKEWSVSGSKAIRKEPEQIFQEISPSVVYIITMTAAGEEVLGSGFIVKSNGFIVTNYHVVESAENISVKLKDGKIFPVDQIVYYNVLKDICLLKINAAGIPVVGLEDSDKISIGEKIYTIGNPLGLEYSFSDGMLAGTRDLQGTKFLQFTAPVSPGNSGGPLLNAEGKAIGIVTFQATGGQNLNFALAINEIKSYIIAPPKTKTIFQQFKDKISGADNYLIQGNKFALQNDYNQAIYYFEKAIQIDPNYVEGYLGLGLSYSSLEKYEQGISYFLKVIQIDPKAGMAYMGLGSTYLELGQYQQAISYLKKAIQLDQNSYSVYLNLGTSYLQLEQYQEAIFWFSKAIKLNPDISTPYCGVANAYDGLGRKQEAISFYEKCVEMSPNANVYVLLGRAHYSLGQNQKAKQSFQKAKELYQKTGDDKGISTVDKWLNVLR